MKLSLGDYCRIDVTDSIHLGPDGHCSMSRRRLCDLYAWASDGKGLAFYDILLKVSQ
jgi:hypothetical protein